MAENGDTSLVRQVLTLQANNKTTEVWLEMTLNALRKHCNDFDSIVDRLPSDVGVKQSYTAIVKQIFGDGIVNWRTTCDCDGFRNISSTVVWHRLKNGNDCDRRRPLFNWMLNGGGKFERRLFPNNFQLLDWLTYGAVLLLSKINQYI